MLNVCPACCPYAERVHRLPVQLGVVLAAFVAASALAGLFGAESLGIALSFGQIGFSLGLAYVLLRA